MFKLIVAFALVAVCAAQTGQFLIDIGDSNVIVRNVNNNQEVKFYVNNQVGLASRNRVINVEVVGPQEFQKVLQFEDVPVYGGQYLSEFLYQIFRKYAGQLDQVQYVELLNTITRYVQKNQVNPIVLYALLNLVGQNQAILNQYAQQYNQGIYGQYNQGIYGQYNQGIYGLYGQKYNQGIFSLFGQKYNQGTYGQYDQRYNQGIYSPMYYQGQYARTSAYQPYGSYSGYSGPYSSSYNTGYYGPYSDTFYGQQLGRQSYFGRYQDKLAY